MVLQSSSIHTNNTNPRPFLKSLGKFGGGRPSSVAKHSTPAAPHAESTFLAREHSPPKAKCHPQAKLQWCKVESYQKNFTDKPVLLGKKCTQNISESLCVRTHGHQIIRAFTQCAHAPYHFIPQSPQRYLKERQRLVSFRPFLNSLL